MTQKKKNILAAVLPLVYMIGILAGAGIYFETNDDRYMNEIFTGILSVQPDAHAVFINYLLGVPIAWLNRISTRIPWYGLLLMLFHYSAYAAILKSLYAHCARKADVAAASIAMGLIFCVDIYMLGQIQFTTTAALLAVAGYTALIGQKDTKKKWIVFFVLELLAYLLRSQAMLMIQPMGFLVWTVSVFLSAEKGKEALHQIAVSGAALVCVLVIGALGNGIGYPSEVWEDYDRFNTATGYMFDYYQKPAYEEVQDILETYDVTRAEYDACMSYAMLDWSVSPECAEALLTYAEKAYRPTFDFKELFVSLIKCNLGSSYWWIARAYVAVTAMGFLYLLYHKSWRVLCALLAEVGAQETVLFYLLWKGRTPSRVMIPIFVGGIMLNLLLVVKDHVSAEKSRKRFVTFVIAGCFAGAVVGYAAKEQYVYIRELAVSQEVLMQSMYELQDYCAAHPEYCYLLEENGQSYFRGSALETNMYQTRNSLTMGGWFSGSPSFLEKLHTYWNGDFDKLRLIILETGQEAEHAAVVYLEAWSGCEGRRVESFEVAHGGRYAVYAFDGRAGEQE